MTGIIGVYHNLILKGGLAAVPHPTLFMGSGTFIDKTSVFGGSVLEGTGQDKHDAPTYNYFFHLHESVDSIFGNLFRRLEPRNHPGHDLHLDRTDNGPTVLQLIDIKKQKVKRIHLMKNKVLQDWTGIHIRDRYLKFPFVCGGAKDSWGMRQSAGTNWTEKDLAISFVIGGLFESAEGRKIGDHICEALSLVVPRLPPSNLDGSPRDNLIQARKHESQSCGRAMHLKMRKKKVMALRAGETPAQGAEQPGRAPLIQYAAVLSVFGALTLSTVWAARWRSQASKGSMLVEASVVELAEPALP